jgi:hypothetical protein
VGSAGSVARMGGTRIPISLCLTATPAGVGGDVLRDVIATKGVNDHGRGSSCMQGEVRGDCSNSRRVWPSQVIRDTLFPIFARLPYGRIRPGYSSYVKLGYNSESGGSIQA